MQGRVINNFIFLVSLFLVACGGGGSGDDVPKKADPDIIKPKITLITPTPGTNTFANNDVIKIDFDEPINQTAKINTVLITPYDSNGIISNNSVTLTNVKFTVEKNALIIEILQTLTAATKYQVIVKKVADIADNEMQGTCEWEFATKGFTPVNSINTTSIGACGSTSNTTPPTIISVAPTSSPLLVTTPIIIKFDKAIDTSTIKASIRLSEQTPSVTVIPFPYNISYDASKLEVTLTPKINSPLSYNTQYSLTVLSKDSGIKDRSGNPLTDDFIFTFKTNLEPSADISQPVIKEVLPLNNSTVKSDTVVTITFSKPMDSTTLQSNIELNDISQTPKASLLFTIKQINPTTVILSAEPSINPLLSPFTNYELIIGAVTDLCCGQPLKGNYITNFSTSEMSANSNQWTWIGGSQSNGAESVFSGANLPLYPGSRLHTATWKVSKKISDGTIEETFWVFGGIVCTITNGCSGLVNELWKYEPTSNLWTELSVGANRTVNAPGQYGDTLATPIPINTPSSLIYPGARRWAMSWTDTNGDLWLFGGYGYDSTGQYGRLTDLWRYTPLSKQWTWVKGDKTASSPVSYGTRGVAADTNQPPSRIGSSTWFDNDGSLWLFGGERLSDLWKYIPAKNMWVWVSGSKIRGQKGVYTGTNATPVTPGAHSESVYWTDTFGKFWLFGGYGWSETKGRQNDLWMYTPPAPATLASPTIGTGTWEFIGGSTTANAYGIYGQKLISNPRNNNIPGARYDAFFWVDSQNNLWLYGGDGYGVNGITGLLNDLWKFDGITKKWTWMNGNDNAQLMQPVDYGSNLGSPTNTTTPGTRLKGNNWIDSNDNLWLLGGYGLSADGVGLKNDLWKYTP